MEIDMSLVRKLRSEVQAPLDACKLALQQSGGDYEKAKANLRTMGLANAEKRASRLTNAGFVAAFTNGSFGIMVEMSSETDFVAKSSIFQSLLTVVLFTALHNKVDNIDDLLKFKVDLRVVNAYAAMVAQASGSAFAVNNDEISQIVGESIEYAIKIVISVVGENVVLSQLRTLKAPEGSFIVSYLHGKQSHVVGVAGSLLVFRSDVDLPEVKLFASKLAAHIVALKPEVVKHEQVSETMLNKEKAVYLDQLAQEGKTGDIAEKIIAGKLSKYYERIVLLKQPYFFDQSYTVEHLLDSKRSEFGATVFEVVDFKIFFLGSSD